MTKLLIETQYFPTIAFFALAYHYEDIMLDIDENYHKGSYRNRAYIMSSQGPLALSVPLKSGKNSQTNIKEVMIDHQDNWQVNHRRAIDACYGKSPYYEYYIHHFIPIFDSEHSHLFDLNLETIKVCLRILGIHKNMEFSEKYLTGSEKNIDLRRDLISPKKKDKWKLDQYFCFKLYDQVFADEQTFAPNLSILDLIFCLGPEARLYLASAIK